MDASTRSYHVYGKTQAGVGALESARGALAPAARQLLVLIDGQRTLGDLLELFDEDELQALLGLLESHGYVQLIRRFPGADDPPAPPRAPRPPAPKAGPSKPAAPKPAPASAATAGRTPRALSNRHTALAALLSVVCATWLFAGETTLTQLRQAQDALVHAAAALTTAQPVPGTGVPEPAPVPAAVRPDATPATTRNPAPDRPSVQNPTRSQPSTSTAGDGPAPQAGPVLHVRTQVAPELPKAARDLGIKSGHAVVVLHVDARGTVERVELVSATPAQVYDDQMQRAFEQWSFDPPGVPGRMTVQVDLVAPRDPVDPAGGPQPAAAER
jgi:TonB family protein